MFRDRGTHFKDKRKRSNLNKGYLNEHSGNVILMGIEFLPQTGRMNNLKYKSSQPRIAKI